MSDNLCISGDGKFYKSDKQQGDGGVLPNEGVKLMMKANEKRQRAVNTTKDAEKMRQKEVHAQRLIIKRQQDAARVANRHQRGGPGSRSAPTTTRSAPTTPRSPQPMTQRSRNRQTALEGAQNTRRGGGKKTRVKRRRTKKSRKSKKRKSKQGRKKKGSTKKR